MAIHYGLAANSPFRALPSMDLLCTTCRRRQWDLNGLQSLQPNSGSTVVVRSISRSPSKPNTIIVAGSFAQAGSLRCQGICSFDTQAKQWNALGDGIQGEVASVVMLGYVVSIPTSFRYFDSTT
jgi:hypothetical protein